jgi:hypothetical protein
LTPPSQAYEEAYGRELGAILVKGRDSAALKQAFVEGFKKIGVR